MLSLYIILVLMSIDTPLAGERLKYAIVDFVVVLWLY